MSLEGKNFLNNELVPSWRKHICYFMPHGACVTIVISIAKNSTKLNVQQKINVTNILSVNITALDEHEMAQALVGYQPVSIAFEVVSDFMHYKDGVYSSTDCKVRTFILNRPQISNLVFRMVQMMSTTLSWLSAMVK